MRTIHLGNDKGEKISVAEAEIESMRVSGKLNPYSVYWVDGMPEWKPLAELLSRERAPEAPPLPAAATPAPPVPAPRAWVPPTSSGGYRRKSPKLLTRAVLFLLASNLLMLLVLIYHDVLQIELLQREFTQEEGIASDRQYQAVRWTYAGIYIVTIIFFAMWIHRSNNNCHSFGARGMRFRPGWAVGCFFVPVVNIWKPYQMMQEMWRASLDPHGWSRQKVPFLVSLWWGMWIFWAMCGWVSNLMFKHAANRAEILTALKADMVASGIGILECLIAMALIWGLYTTQRRLVRGETVLE